MLTEAKKAAFLMALRQQMAPTCDVLADEVEEVRHGTAPTYTSRATTPPTSAVLPLQNPE